jgi:CRISPR/Cas system CSM-associated protein Csm5 (group 7 of RAMP superfamily)
VIVKVREENEVLNSGESLYIPSGTSVSGAIRNDAIKELHERDVHPE